MNTILKLFPYIRLHSPAKIYAIRIQHVVFLGDVLTAIHHFRWINEFIYSPERVSRLKERLTWLCGSALPITVGTVSSHQSRPKGLQKQNGSGEFNKIKKKNSETSEEEWLGKSRTHFVDLPLTNFMAYSGICLNRHKTMSLNRQWREREREIDKEDRKKRDDQVLPTGYWIQDRSWGF